MDETSGEQEYLTEEEIATISSVYNDSVYR